MKKNILILFIGMIYGLLAAAQTPIFTVIDGTSHVIKSGTVVSMDGLVLTPSQDYSLSGKNLTRKPTATNTIINPNISNYYAFNGTTNAFTGSIKFNYSDAELNGLNEANLKLNIFMPSTWSLQQNTTINTVDNFATSSLTAVLMKELTLGTCAPTSVVATNTSQTVCTGTAMASIALSDVLNTSGTTYSWTRTNTGSLTGIASSGTGSTIGGSLVNATTTQQSTVFTIMANRPNGCSSTTTATVSVNPKPSISSQPVKTTKYATQTATFSIVATGLPLSYQWQQYSSDGRGILTWSSIANGGIYSGANTSTLTLTGVSLLMNGYQFRCMVNGQCSPAVTSAAATLFVVKPNNSNLDPISSTPRTINVLPEETNKAAALEIYPNPTQGAFKLMVNNFNIDKATVRVTDARGRLILIKEVTISSRKQMLPLFMNFNAQGTYFIQVVQLGKSGSIVLLKE